MRPAFLAGSMVLGMVLVIVGMTLSAEGEDKGDTQIAVLAGEWKVSYTHDAVRVYTVDLRGKVSCDDPKLTGQIKRKAEMLLVTFTEEDKLERWTLGTDGRLFVEHYDPKGDFPDKKATHMGIGIRQK